MNVFIKRDQDYALRICAYLAGKPEKKPISLTLIARILFISRPFASKIVFQLRQAGIIGSAQGKLGGIFLMKNPNEITLFDIFTAMNFDSTINECIRNHHICPRTGFCQIHHYFREQENLLINSYKNKKVADFAIYEEDLSH